MPAPEVVKIVNIIIREDDDSLHILYLTFDYTDFLAYKLTRVVNELKAYIYIYICMYKCFRVKAIIEPYHDTVCTTKALQST